MTLSVNALSALVESNHDPQVIVMESSPAPSEVAGVYETIGAAAINDNGEVAFSATLSDSSITNAIFLQSGNSTHAVLKAGDAAPVDGRYRKFLELDLARFTWVGVEGKFLFFRAELDGSSSAEGVFLWSPEKVEPIALAGNKSPRGSVYKSFSHPIIAATSANNGVSFFLAFVAVMDDDSKSLIFGTSRGLEEVLATGDKLEGNTVKDFAISQIGAFAVGCVAEMRPKRSGEPYNEVLVIAEDIIANHGVLREGSRFESMGKKVKRIFGPPAISFQASFVALQFKRKKSAIVFRDVFGDPAIVAKSGQPAPGLSDENIESFGAPIANAVIPIPRGRAILSMVRLSSGRSALWGFISKSDFLSEAETKLLLVEGSISQGQGLALQSVIPLKVTNNGTVLLRATIGEGIATRQGLFIMNGLFDE